MTVSPLDRDFLSGFPHGSYESVNELYHLYYAPLTEFAEQLITSNAEAHHIVQETFLKLYLLRGQFNNMANIKAFLYITVRNICFSYMKSEPADTANEQAGWATNESKLANRFNDETVRNNAVQQAHKEMEQLPASLRVILRLIFGRRLTVPAIAEELGIDAVTIGRERIKAIRLLREQLYAKDLFSVPFFVYFLINGDRES